MVEWWDVLRVGSLAVGGTTIAGLAARAAYRTGLQVYDDLHERWRAHRQDRLTLEHLSTQNALRDVREIKPDDHGRWPLLYGRQGILRDPNSLKAFTLEAVIEHWPDLDRLDWTVRQLIAMQGLQAGTARQVPALTPDPVVAWPASVRLADLIAQGGRPGLHRLILGLALEPDGTERIVYGDMSEMVHVLVSGASNFGKSVLLEALAKQLVIAGDCDLAFVDYGINTFGRLADYGLYPIADTPTMAIALFQELIAEMRRRRDLFRGSPECKDLGQFNAKTGSDLRPLICFVDESAALFAKKGTKGPATELAQMGRKFGIGLVFAGTDFKADTLPTEATGNFGARIALHLRPTLSQSLLGNRRAAALRVKGRALAELPGVADLVEMQCPIVREWGDLPVAHAQEELPEVPEAAARVRGVTVEQVGRVCDLAGTGASVTRIAREVFGHGTTHYIEKVRAILRQQQQDGGLDGGQVGGGTD